MSYQTASFLPGLIRNVTLVETSVSGEGKRKGLSSLFGQDECIFHQFIFTGSAWVGPKGEQGIIQMEKRPLYTEAESALKVNGTAIKSH